MARLGSQVGLPAGRTVTVTSASARFPIAITSTSRTPIHAVLVVSGPDLTSSTVPERRAQARHDQPHHPRAHAHFGRFQPAAAASVPGRARPTGTRRADDEVHGDIGGRDRAHRWRRRLPRLSGGSAPRGAGAAGAGRGMRRASCKHPKWSGNPPREAQAPPLLRARATTDDLPGATAAHTAGDTGTRRAHRIRDHGIRAPAGPASRRRRRSVGTVAVPTGARHRYGLCRGRDARFACHRPAADSRRHLRPRVLEPVRLVQPRQQHAEHRPRPRARRDPDGHLRAGVRLPPHQRAPNTRPSSRSRPC